MISGSAPPSSTSWFVASIILAAHAKASGLHASVSNWKHLFDKLNQLVLQSYLWLQRCVVTGHKVFLTCEHEVEEVARGRQHYSVCQDVLPIHHQDDITEDPLNTGQRSHSALETINAQACVDIALNYDFDFFFLNCPNNLSYYHNHSVLILCSRYYTKN